MLRVEDTEAVEFSAELLDKCKEIISRYPEGKEKSALLPILHEVQAVFGWLSATAMDKVAEILNIKDI